MHHAQNFGVCCPLRFLSISKSFASDDYPHGCIINYNGAERVFTDFIGIDPVGGARMYSLTTSYKQGTGNCEAMVSYTTPYSGGCSIPWVNTGANVTIAALYNCPLDKGETISIILLAIGGVAAIRKTSGTKKK